MKCLLRISLCVFLACGFLEAAPELEEKVVELLKPKLNSDRIEYFFGNYAIETLDIQSSAFPGSRITNLYSVHEGKKVMRTLAVVDFFDPVHPNLKEAHRQISEGKSIGIALRDEGWMIQKRPVYFGEIALSPSVMEWMDEAHQNQAAVHVYRLEVSKNNEMIPYCTIIEVHSPQYLSQEWLKAFYPDQYDAYSVVNQETADLLERLSILMKEFR
jgi:hypothetical protein